MQSTSLPPASSSKPSTPHPYASILSSFKSAYQEGGYRVFVAGLGPTLVRSVPVNMVSLTFSFNCPSFHAVCEQLMNLCITTVQLPRLLSQYSNSSFLLFAKSCFYSSISLSQFSAYREYFIFTFGVFGRRCSHRLILGLE